MIHEFTKSAAPVEDGPDVRIALRHVVTGEAMLALGVIPSANSWDESVSDDGTVTLTLRVDDDPSAT